MKTKVIISGCRDYEDYGTFKRVVLNYLRNIVGEIEIVEGDCRGTDKMAERLSIEMGWALEKFPPDWAIGAIAGPIRNRKMGEYGDILIAFWDRKSKGTDNMIKTMKELNKPLRVHNI